MEGPLAPYRPRPELKRSHFDSRDELLKSLWCSDYMDSLESIEECGEYFGELTVEELQNEIMSLSKMER